MSGAPILGVVINSEGLGIPFIDDSGSSSCASSLFSEEAPYFEEEPRSLSRLLDDAASRELSFNDLASLSCGYASLEPSDGRSEGGTIDRLKRPLRRKLSKSLPSAIDVPKLNRKGPTKSANMIGIDESSLNKSIMADPDISLKVSQTPPKSDKCSYSSESSNHSDLPEKEPLCPEDSRSTHSSDDRALKADNATPKSDASHLGTDKMDTTNRSFPSLTELDDTSLLKTPNHRRVQSISMPIQSFCTNEIRECSTPLVSFQYSPECQASTISVRSDISSPFSTGSRTTQTTTASEKWRHSACDTAAQDNTNPAPTNVTQQSNPFHYISSLRVASMKGAADMGGALVARVAAFLKTQYKSLVTSPLYLPWCPRYKLPINDFDASLVQIPLEPHFKVPRGQICVSSILQSQIQVPLNELTVEDRPKRVLVEGEVGYCCSTICYKMAYDWAIIPTASYMKNYSLVFVLTLRDFRGGSVFSYMCKEILPRHILSREAMNTLWNHLKKIEDKVLFLLVGYDELCEEESGDLRDLIDGQLLPGASVVIASRIGASKPMPMALHRRYLITGLNLEQTENCIRRYFKFINAPETGDDVMPIVKMSQERYGDLLRCPVMSLAMCVLYEDLGGKLPSRLTEFFMSLIKHMTRKNLIRRGEPMCYDVLPEKYVRLLQEFGKLALDALKQRKPYFTGADLKTKVSHGGEIVNLGVLVRMRSMSKLNKKEYYAPSHIAFLEFIAAYYISSLSQNYAQLQSELDGLAESLDISIAAPRNSSGIMVLRYLSGLLSRNAYILFNILSQMAVSHRLLFLLIRESGQSQINVLEVCKYVSGRGHVVIQTNSDELEDWGQLLYSPDCSLESIEVLLDFDGSSREQHECFFTCMSFNESVMNVKLTCLVGGDFGETEVTRLVSYVRAVLTKRRLESFEIQVTSLEDSSTEILSPVVDMICDVLPDLAPTLTKLVLALELEGDQVVRLSEVLARSPQVKVLHLPHLACGIQGLQGVAKIVETNPLISLNLAGSLSSGTPIDERTSLGTQSPSKEDGLPVAFWSFVDAQGNTKSVFNSLPRSFYQSLPRSRRLNSIANDKRNSDSTLLHKTSFPPPVCSPAVHQNGFHHIFTAFRMTSCHVSNLNISKCTLSAEDLVCLGETLRFSKSLTSLRMEGLSRMAEIIPLLIALQENTSLSLLDLTSPHILLGDAAFQMTLNCLRKNKSLRFLVLNGWTIQLENERSMKEFASFLSKTELQSLDLSGAKVVTTVQDGALAKESRQGDLIGILQSVVPPLTNNSIAFLNLDRFEVHINNRIILRGPQLMGVLRNFTKIVELSLESNFGSDAISNTTTSKLFSMIPSAFPCLRKLRISGWVFSLDNCEKCMRSSGKYLKNSQLREIYLSGVKVRESSGKVDMEYTLLSAITSNLHHLSLLSLVGMSLSPMPAAILGKVIKEKMLCNKIELETKGIEYDSLKMFRQTLTDGGRYELSFLGGPTGLYEIKKVERKEKMLSKWVCLSSDKYD